MELSGGKMKIEDFNSGIWEQGYKYKYFVPAFINHPFSWEDDAISALLEKASLKLGELNSFSRFVPDIDIFISMYVLKEAVVSSRIEGTRTNIEEALEEEQPSEPEKRDDWLEVNNYVKAINSAIEELKTLPLSCRLIRDTHRILLSSGRGERKTPGEFRISQNWIGGASIVDAVFVPPAADKLSDVTSLSNPFVLNIVEHIREDGLSKTVFLKAGSLVLSNSATLGIPKILDLDTCIHDGWLYFPKSQLSNEYLYLLFKEIRPQLINLGNGSIFTNLKTDILRNYEVTLPNKETLSNFQNIIKSIFEKMLFIQRETKQLEIIRDILLPKLMSGEIDVESVKI